MVKPTPPVNYLHELFEYRADGVLIWRERPRSHFDTPRGHNVFNALFAGKIAGSTAHQSGYVHIRFDQTFYKAHRLIYAIINGDCSPEFDIDHINGDVADNRIENLRPATRRQNVHNSRMQRRNSSGYKGVTWHIKAKKWCAGIKHNGKRKHLGLFDTAELAHEIYDLAAQLLHGEFYKS